jgi:hypothetical protein
LGIRRSDGKRNMVTGKKGTDTIPEKHPCAKYHHETYIDILEDE